jgi:hypothetical protein
MIRFTMMIPFLLSDCFFKNHAGAAAGGEFETQRIGRAGLAFFDAQGFAVCLIVAVLAVLDDGCLVGAGGRKSSFTSSSRASSLVAAPTSQTPSADWRAMTMCSPMTPERVCFRATAFAGGR